MDINVTEVAYHRNGISGEGLFVCAFSCDEGQNFMGVVFLPECSHDDDGYMTDPDGWEPHNPSVAIFDVDKLPDVRFMHNSWRGDHFAPALYKAIYQQQAE